MAKEMQTYFLERTRAAEAKGAAAPRELVDLDARIARLRARLQQGDPDMPPDEIQAAIDRAEGKRRELQAAQPAARASAKVLTMLPRAAAEYRDQIERGLDGNAREAAKARIVIRDLCDGKIRLQPTPDGGLVALWNLQPAALLKGVGTCGSGGRI
jgi:site-specific DNA recombinase